jgi:hypothetical protein
MAIGSALSNQLVNKNPSIDFSFSSTPSNQIENKGLSGAVLGISLFQHFAILTKIKD